MTQGKVRHVRTQRKVVIVIFVAVPCTAVVAAGRARAPPAADHRNGDVARTPALLSDSDQASADDQSRPGLDNAASTETL